MGTNYFVIPMDAETDFKLDLADFANKLKAQWPALEVQFQPDSFSALQWTGEPIWGDVQRDMQTVVLEKPREEEFAKFALWYRSIVPAQHRLFMFNDSEAREVELKVGMSYLKILRALGNSPRYAHSIKPDQSSQFTLNLKDFTGQLRHQWPEVEIFPIEAGDPYSFYWEIKTLLNNGEALDSGAVSRDKTKLHLFYFPASEIAKMALWYRSIIPPEQKLTLYYTPDKKQLDLRTDTTEQDIIDIFERA